MMSQRLRSIRGSKIVKQAEALILLSFQPEIIYFVRLCPDANFPDAQTPYVHGLA